MAINAPTLQNPVSRLNGAPKRSQLAGGSNPAMLHSMTKGATGNGRGKATE